MGMNIVGNVNGSYKASQIDLFEIAKKRGIEEQPIKTVSSILGENSAIKVNISEEGLKALHGSKLNGNDDLESRIQQMEYMSEHQPVESFTSRLGRTLQESYEGLSYEQRPSVEEKGYSKTKIAQMLQIDRKTVRKILNEPESPEKRCLYLHMQSHSS